MKVLLAIGILAAAVLLWWRGSAGRPRPCPYWLTGLLENPYMNALAGSAALLDRAGVEPGMRLLDVGCGPGRVAIPAARRVGPSGHVTAFDLQPEMLRKVEDRARAAGLANLRTVQGAIGTGMLGAEEYDRAFLVTVLGEIPDRRAALAEIYGALVPGGVLSITEVIPDPHYRNRETVVRAGEAAGFRLVGEFGTWLAFTLNFERPREAA